MPKQHTYQATIMLSPYSIPGRKFSSNYEHTIAYQFAIALKKNLEKEWPNIRIVLSHKRNEQIQSLQIANTANCLQIDLFFHFQFYQEQEFNIPSLYVYHFSYGNDFPTKIWDLSWCRVDQAYLINKVRTRQWAQQMKIILQGAEYHPWFTAHGPYKVPLKPLLGIMAPGFVIEMGIKEDADWQNYINPVTTSMVPIMEELTKCITSEELA